MIEVYTLPDQLANACAFSFGRYGVPEVRELLESGADAAAPTTRRVHALHMCVHWRNEAAADVLFHIGRVPVDILYDNQTALQYAVLIEREGMALWLLRHGASTRVPFEKGWKWWDEIMEQRERCRRVVITLIGIRRFRRALTANGMDEVRLIGQHVWARKWD